MGIFTDNIRANYSNRPKKVKPANIREDGYFIRIKQSVWTRLGKQLQGIDDEYAYLHYDGEVDKENVAYRAKKGVIGACVFGLNSALALIRESGANNLELVKINKVIDKRS